MSGNRKKKLGEDTDPSTFIHSYLFYFIDINFISLTLTFRQWWAQLTIKLASITANPLTEKLASITLKR